MARIEKLKELEVKLYVAMQSAQNKDLATLAKQYRETLKEIEEIEGAEQNDDDIAEIISEREPWMPGAVRPSRS